MRNNNETEAIKNLKNCRRNISRYFDNFLNNCESQMRQEVDEMFDVLEEDGCSYIDAGYDDDDLENEINSDVERLSGIVENNFKVIVHNESIDLTSQIEQQMEKIKETIGQMQVRVNSEVSLDDIDLSVVLNELDLSFGDLVNWASYLGGCGAIGWAIAAGNWWNPLGWGLAIGGLIGIIFGDSKEDKAKKKFREKINEAKSDFMQGDFSDKLDEFENTVGQKKRETLSKIDNIISQAKKIQESIDNALGDLDDMSSNLG